MTKEVMQQAFDLIERLNQLKSVLCDPEGKCCVAGSDEDRAIVDRALEALAQPPLPVQPEPLEYWNAVEGWVKIDEVREHFDAVNCGTIYKHGGEGRVPLYTAPPQQQAEPPPEWPLIKNILDEYGLDAISFVAEWKAAQQQAEPVQKLVAWGVFDGNLHDMFFTEEEAQEMVRLKGDGSTVAPLYTTPPLPVQPEPVTWDKPSDNFNAWWDGDRRRDNANPFQTDSFAYWAFEGWQAALAQRPWVGLEAEDLAQIESDEFWQVGNHMAIAMAVEAKLKEKNHG